MLGGKSVLPIKLKPYTNYKGLVYEQGYKYKANIHLNGATRVSINLSENPRLTPTQKPSSIMLGGKSVLPIKLKPYTNYKGLVYEQGYKYKANIHLNGATRVRIHFSENPPHTTT